MFRAIMTTDHGINDWPKVEIILSLDFIELRLMNKNSA